MADVSNVLKAANLSSTPNLQGLIELVYVQQINNIVANQLSKLNDALTINQQVLDVLTQLQNMKNFVTAKDKGSFNFNYGWDQGGQWNFPGAYTQKASAFFGTPISISVSYPGNNFTSSFQIPFQLARSALSTIYLAKLSALTPSASLNDPTTLYAAVKKVLSDMSNMSPTPTAAQAFTWLTDNYNTTAGAGAASAGSIQQHITTAITAAESLNTTQTEKVRSYLFLMEEYYKSAAAMLSQMTQIMQKMAQNITR